MLVEGTKGLMQVLEHSPLKLHDQIHGQELQMGEKTEEDLDTLNLTQLERRGVANGQGVGTSL